MPGGGTSEINRMIRQDAEALSKWVEGFLRDASVRELSPYTVKYYRAQLADFEHCASSTFEDGTVRLKKL